MTFFVLHDDKGIRPAGPPDECFYCHRKVGEAHGDRCVMIVRRSDYRVYASDGTFLGLWTHLDPDGWSAEDCERHKNESSWCMDNLPETGIYSGKPLPEPTDDECLCGMIRVRLFRRGTEATRAAS